LLASDTTAEELRFSLRRRRKSHIAPMARRSTKPPTAPPAMAAIGVACDDEEELVGVAVTVLNHSVGSRV
jgi:hypothetical protein